MAYLVGFEKAGPFVADDMCEEKSGTLRGGMYELEGIGL